LAPADPAPLLTTVDVTGTPPGPPAPPEPPQPNSNNAEAAPPIPEAVPNPGIECPPNIFKPPTPPLPPGPPVVILLPV